MALLNGFTLCDESLLGTYRVPGTVRSLRVRREIAPLLIGFAAEFHALVEPLDGGTLDDWGYACRLVRGAASPSFHGAGIAIDLNALRHVLGKRGTFTPEQAATIRALCKKYGLRWGGDYTTRADEMHVEVILPRAQALALVARLQTPPGEDVALTDAEIVAIANRTAATVWGWQLSGWDKPETNKQAAWERLTGVHETVVRQLTGDASALIEMRNRVMGVLPPTLDELGDALWDAQGVDVDNARTGARELVSVRAALGLAASVIATGRSTAAFGGGLDPDVLAAAVAASIPDDLAEAVVTALRQRTLTVQIQP